MSQPIDAPGVPSLRSGLGHAVWLGLATGYAELAYKAFRKYGRDLFLFQHHDAPWMTPLATAIVFGLVFLALEGAMRLRGRRLTGGMIFGLGTALGVVSVLFLVPVVHKGASMLIAGGLGVQAARIGLGDRRWVRRLRQLTLPLMAVSVAVTALALPGGRWLQARQARLAMPTASRDAPNVLLIILDTVRSLNLSGYGYSKPTTPNLSRRAATGARFAQAWSPAPWTLPSHASMFTGLEAHQLGTDWYVALDDSTRTLAEALRDHGWRTGGFVANLPYTSREVGLGRGFVHYEDHPTSWPAFFSNSALIRTATQNRPLRDAIGWHGLFVQKAAPDLNRALLRWVDGEPGRPFFAFMNYYDAHRPYLPPEPYRSRFLPPGEALQPEARRRPSNAPRWTPEELVGSVASYDGAIAYLDDQLESLFQELERRRLLDNTLIVITSDHGEEFAEHGMIDHGNSLYRPSLAIPLLLWWPGRIPGGAVIPTAVSTRDIPATVVDLLGLGGSAPFPGRSLARFWQPDADSAPTPIYGEVRRAPRLPAWYPSSRGHT